MDLVLGTAFGLSVEKMRVFVESLRRHFDGEVRLLIASRDAEEVVPYLRKHGVVPDYFDCALWMRVNLSMSRFVRYGEMLRGARVEYGRILLSDVSDVVFQGDPFAGLPAGELFCFMEHEGRTIGECFYNSIWIKQHLGEEALAQVRDRTISCSGTTIGTHRAILSYIDRLIARSDPVILNRFSGTRGFDQGVRNYLLHTGGLPGAVSIPNGEHVYTVGFVPEGECVLGPGGKILTPAGWACPIVHQYNYKAGVMSHVSAAWRGDGGPKFFVGGVQYGG